MPAVEARARAEFRGVRHFHDHEDAASEVVARAEEANLLWRRRRCLRHDERNAGRVRAGRTPTRAEIVMTTANKSIANRANALCSTGPKTVEGRAKSSKNALAHGLYAAAVVPALGESPEQLAALASVVRQTLCPEGDLEERLADRVALILLRLDRVTRYESATSSRSAGAANLLPDPDAITGDNVNYDAPAPGPSASPVARLAYARGKLGCWRPARDSCNAALAALDGEGVLRPPLAYAVQRELEVILAWDWEGAAKKWRAIEAEWGDRLSSAGGFRALLGRLAAESGKDVQAVSEGLRERLAVQIAEYDAVIHTTTEEVDALVEQMRAAREAAAGAAVYADGEAVERVIRMEGHLTRQLGLTLDLLDRMRAGRGESGCGDLGAVFREMVTPPLMIRPDGFVS